MGSCDTGSESTPVSVALGDGDDELDDPGAVANFAAGDAGNDRLIAKGPGPVTLMGGPGDDTLEGTPAGDHLYGGTTDPTAPDGNDVIVAADPRTIEQPGADGDDTIVAGAGNDQVAAGVGADVIEGNAGDDSLSGCYTGTACPDGADQISGGDGNDKISGRLGADVIDGGAGDDDITGEDLFTAGITRSGDNDVIHGGPGSDRLQGADGDDQLYGDDGDDNLLGGRGADLISGGAGQDRIEPGDSLLSGFVAGYTPLADDGVVDDISCGSEVDAVFPDSSDLVAPDCEQVGQELTCPATASGSCPVVVTVVMPASPTTEVAPSAAAALVVGGNEGSIAGGKTALLGTPLTRRGIALVTSRGRPVVTAQISIRSPAGVPLETRQVRYVLDARRTGSVSLVSTFDVLAVTPSAKTGALAVRLDVPVAGAVKLTATAALGKARPFTFAKGTSRGPAGRRRVALKPSRRALALLRKGKRLKLSVRLAYTPAGAGAEASIRTVKSVVALRR
jgi:Ca2+-binding RTX toxin-like protein